MTRKALRYIERVRTLLPARREVEARALRRLGHNGSGMLGIGGNGMIGGSSNMSGSQMVDGNDDEHGDDDDTDIVWAQSRPFSKGRERPSPAHAHAHATPAQAAISYKSGKGGPSTPSSAASSGSRIKPKDKR
jgi:hypothetical protein